MDAMREQLNKPLVVGIASFVIGLFIGLVVLGWWLWPVEWVDAGPSNMSIEYQEIYLRMAIDSYTLNQDAAAAQQRIAEVGPNAVPVLQTIKQTQWSNPDSIQVFIDLTGAARPGANSTCDRWLCSSHTHHCRRHYWGSWQKAAPDVPDHLVLALVLREPSYCVTAVFPLSCHRWVNRHPLRLNTPSLSPPVRDLPWPNS
jgi:hypothetical protein